MASSSPNDSSTSAQDSLEKKKSPTSLTSTLTSTSKPMEGPKQGEDIVAWAMAHMNDPPHREKHPRTPGDGSHGGPIRIMAKDGVVTEYGKKVQREYDEKIERERLAKLAAAAAAEEGKEGGKDGGKEVETSHE